MKPPRLGLIVLILGAVALGSYLLSNISQKQNNQNSVSYPSVKLTSPTLATPSFYNLDTKNNLTKNFGDTLYQQIKDGNTPTDINSFSQELTSKAINKSLAEFQLISNVKDSEIKISSDNSLASKAEYLKSIKTTNQKNFAGFSENYLEVIVDTYQKLDYSSAERLANIYKNLAADYLNIKVPVDLVDFHKQLIIYAENAEIVYRAMANYPTDPLKGYLALETIDSLTQGAENIQNIFNEKTKEISLK